MHDDICWYGSIHKTNLKVSCCYLVVTGDPHSCESMNKSLAAWISQHTLLLHQLTHNSPKQTCQKNMQVFCRTESRLKHCAKGLVTIYEIFTRFAPSSLWRIFPTFRFLWSSTSSRQPNGPRTSGGSRSLLVVDPIRPYSELMIQVGGSKP